MCETCPSAEVLDDGLCGNCKFRSLDQTYTEEWRQWMDNLQRLWLWSEAGYDIRDEDLSFDDWQALAVIARHFKMRDLRDLSNAIGGGSSGS